MALLGSDYRIQCNWRGAVADRPLPECFDMSVFPSVVCPAG
jgi:hypothetical protein